MRPFRDGTPYQGEDMMYDERQSRALPRPLHARRREGASDRHVPVRAADRQAELTARFPREWLSDWAEVSQGLEALIAKLRGAGRVIYALALPGTTSFAVPE